MVKLLNWMRNEVLWGNLGKRLFVLTIALVIITAIALPYIMPTLELEFPAKWAQTTRFVVQMAFGSWIGATVSSIAKVIVWLRYANANKKLAEYEKEKRDVILVRDFNLWLLGILTALAAYMTVWVSGD